MQKTAKSYEFFSQQIKNRNIKNNCWKQPENTCIADITLHYKCVWKCYTLKIQVYRCKASVHKKFDVTCKKLHLREIYTYYINVCTTNIQVKCRTGHNKHGCTVFNLAQVIRELKVCLSAVLYLRGVDCRLSRVDSLCRVDCLLYGTSLQWEFFRLTVVCLLLCVLLLSVTCLWGWIWYAFLVAWTR